MDELEKLFCGKWVCDRNENLRESMEAMNMQKEEIDFFMQNQPKMKIVRQSDKVFHSMDLGNGVVDDVTYELGKGLETKDTTRDPPLFHNKDISPLNDRSIVGRRIYKKA
ncbi:uncharacterized protein LOC123549997 isoform X2 [Mercenaria mercenaria]|uniref:uncharacterized protein LOC123549997 isoform X2 n=1 Tax=Mercenaria mercenaria TaxID=6596 RepID=UPI00234EEB85|nr:uncharacterized protein LOC123549997 isoform X2 [Mercenaria mercenaria]